jgi:hypothetical protein
MSNYPTHLACRSVGTWTLHSAHAYANPFADVVVDGLFTSPSGKTMTIPGFYDGEGTWRIRFCPAEEGTWAFRTLSRPHSPDLEQRGSVHVTPSDRLGTLRVTPGQGWGFQDERGAPVFILGDTVYNLFGMAHCGGDVEGFMERRARQGFNLLRVRVPVSPFHPPEGYSDWQTRRTWAWGGSEQAPRFDRFNLDYFATVDRVVQKAEELGLGLEMIMEAWGFEFPFNSRQIFTPEWEELWLRTLIARYDAYNCVSIWTLMNEYEYYPNGDWHYKPVADRWAMRVGRWVKGLAQHGHIVAVHNGPREPAFARRFAADPEAIDAVLFQDWGTRDAEQGWLAAGIEEVVTAAFQGWGGAAIFAEWGYERNPALPPHIPSHNYCDEEHTRRGGWRGAFCGMGIIHGFENSWGPFMLLEHDQAGLAYLLLLRHFFTAVVPFARLRPAPVVVAEGNYPAGHRPLALASAERDVVAVYLPVGGTVTLCLPRTASAYRARWFNPCTGELSPAQGAGDTFVAPVATQKGHPQDWVLVLE